MPQVQELALPPALAGDDLIVQAHTGSGKTLVFALTIMQKLALELNNAQAVVLCPTRELASQVADSIPKGVAPILLSKSVYYAVAVRCLDKSIPWHTALILLSVRRDALRT